MGKQNGCARHDAQSKCHATCAPWVLQTHDNGPLGSEVTRALFFLTEAAVMLSAPWLHHSTGETPGDLMKASCLPVDKVPFSHPRVDGTQ